MLGWLLFALIVVSVFAIAWAFCFAPKVSKTRLEVADRGAHLTTSLVTAIAIVAAGLLYMLERQWTPRFTVELHADIQPVKGTAPPRAVMQLTVAITNQGRTTQRLNNIEVAATGFRGPKLGTPNSWGDLSGKQIYHFTSQHWKEIGPGETDVAYFEAPVRCYWPLVRVQAKVPQPPFNPATPEGQRYVYQRKLLVPVAEKCLIED